MDGWIGSQSYKSFNSQHFRNQLLEPFVIEQNAFAIAQRALGREEAVDSMLYSM